MAKYLLRALKNMGEIEIESDSIPRVNLRARQYLTETFDNAPDIHVEILKIEEDKPSEPPPPDFQPVNRAGAAQQSPFALAPEPAPELPPDFHPQNVAKKNPGAAPF